jgi:hypothetical protein
MAIPPIKAVGFLCHRSLVGCAIHPFLDARLRTMGVRTRHKMKDVNGSRKDMFFT